MNNAMVPSPGPLMFQWTSFWPGRMFVLSLWIASFVVPSSPTKATKICPAETAKELETWTSPLPFGSEAVPF
jgi:hypothetical protein